MTPLGLGFAVIMVFLLAFFYETVINLRARYDASLIRQASVTTSSTSATQVDGGKIQPPSTSCCTTSIPVESGDNSEFPAPVKIRRPFTICQSFIRSSLFAFSNFYSLFLMMIFMTYNAYLCIALVLGAGTGHFWSSVFIPEADIMNRPRSCCN